MKLALSWPLLALVVTPAAVSAESGALHVFGPEGISGERRVLAALEGPLGRCVRWEGVQLVVDDQAGAVEPGEVLGDCVRWLRVTAGPQQETVTLRAISGDTEAVASVGLGGRQRISFRLERVAAAVSVRAPVELAGEGVSAVAYWAGGQASLQPTEDGALRGEVPPEALVGVVMRSGQLVGAELSAASARPPPGPSAFLMPTGLAVQAGGAPRTAAFLVVANQQGIPSKTVPLNITSERGRLRSLDWRATGLAEIQLSAKVGVPSVDLVVSHGRETLCSLELPVVASWPVAASLEAPAQAKVGEPFRVALAATTLDGGQVEPALLRLGCAGRQVPLDDEGGAECALEESGELVAVALIDGLPVPLSSRSVEVVEPASEPLVPAPAEQREAPLREPRGWLLPLLSGGLDTWLRGSLGVGLRFELGLAELSWLRWGVSAVYSLSRFQAPPAGGWPEVLVEQVLEGFHHDLDLSTGPIFEVLDRRVQLTLRAEVGAVLSVSEATLDGLDASTVSVRMLAGVVLGGQASLGRLSFGWGAGMRWLPVSSREGWSEAPLRFLVELSLSIPLGGRV